MYDMKFLFVEVCVCFKRYGGMFEDLKKDLESYGGLFDCIVRNILGSYVDMFFVFCYCLFIIYFLNFWWEI